MSEPTANSPLRPWRRVLPLAASLAILAAAAWFTWRAAAEVGWSELFARFRAMPPAWLALGAAALAARFWLLDRRWAPLLERIGARVPHHQRRFIVLASVAANHATPALRITGGLLRARYAAGHAGPGFSTIYGAVLLDQAAHHVVTGTLTWVAIVIGAWLAGARALALVAAALLAAVLALGASPPVRRWLRPREAPDSEPAPVTRLARLAAAGRRALGSFRRLLAEPELRGHLVLVTLAFAACNVLAQWFLLRGLGSGAPLAGVAVAVLVGAAAGTLSGTPGGLGATEATMLAAYAALGLSAEEAVSGTLVYRGLHYALVLVLGAPSLLLCELLHRRRTAALESGR